MAERRDLMVATYSLLCGTGERVTVAVCTGIPRIPAPAGGGAAFFSQPAAAKQTATRQMNPRLRFKALILTESLVCVLWLWPCVSAVIRRDSK